MIANRKAAGGIAGISLLPPETRSPRNRDIKNFKQN